MTKKIQKIPKSIYPIIYGDISSDAIFDSTFFLLKIRNHMSHLKKASNVKVPLYPNARIIDSNFKLFNYALPKK